MVRRLGWALVATLACCTPSSNAGSRLAGDEVALRSSREGHPVSAVAPPPPWFYEGGRPGCMRRVSSTQVDLDPTAHTALRHPTPASFSDGLSAIATAPWGEELQRFVIADRGRGVRVLDARDAPNARVTASTPLPMQPLELRVAGDRALLILAEPQGGHELWWLGLSASEAPIVIARQLQAGELRGAHGLPERAGGEPARIALVVDVLDDGPCGHAKRTLIRVLELEPERITVAQDIDLGSHVQRVLRSGDWLAVHDHRPSERGELSSELRFVDRGQRALSLSAPFAVSRNVHAFHADGRVLDVASWDAALTDPPHQASLRGRYTIGRVRVARAGKLERGHACTIELAAPPVEQAWQAAELPRLMDALFLPERSLLTFLAADVAKSDVRAIDHRTCAATATTLPGARFMLTQERDLLVGLGPMEAPTLEVTVHDPRKLGAPAATARFELVKPALRSDSVLGSSHTFWASGARWQKHGAQRLLSVPFQQYQPDGALVEGGQLVEIQASAVRAREYRGWLWLTSPSGATAYLMESGLRLGEQNVHDLWPRHIDAQLLSHRSGPGAPTALARIRYPGSRPAYDAHTDALKAQLELVPGERDPQNGRAVQSFEISGNARLDSVGSLLVASSQQIARDETARARPCRFEVFDTLELQAAKRLASLVDTTLCDAGHALSDQPSFSTPKALVFARTEHRYDGPHEITGARIAYYALDLREPTKPVLRGPFRTAEGEYALGVFGDGTRVLQAFRVTAPPTHPKQPVAYHYVRYVDFSDPSAPRFEAPIAVAGEAIGWHGDMLYTREAQWRGETAEHTVHQWLIQPDGRLDRVASGLEERAVYDQDRVPAVEEDDVVVDSSPDELLLIKQGTLRRIPRVAAP